MAKSFLLVHGASYSYITALIDYILSQIKACSPFPVEFVVCDRIDKIKADSGSVIFAAGQFGEFSRQPNCRYIIFNFELLYLAHGASYSAIAKRWIQSKKLRFEQKVRFYDFVLDFHANQTALVSAEFGVPVRVFPICMRAPMPRERVYDICVVGSPTPRRVAIEKRLSRLGIRLSPSTGIVLEEAASQSKIVLNVHAYRSPNIELPRMVGGMMAGAALVTEQSPGVDRYLPSHLYLIASYHELVNSVISLLGQPERIERMASVASGWLKETYVPECEARWRTLLQDVYRD